MCELCFNREYSSFIGYKEFDQFDSELSKKLNDEGLSLSSDKGVYQKTGFDIYICVSCSETWWLSIPDNAWRGFFLKEENAKSHIDNLARSDKSKRYGCLIFLLILATFITIYYINN